MDVLQTIFYVMGIVFMSLSIFILIAIIFLLFYIKKKVSDIQKSVEEKLSTVSSFMHQAEAAANMGASVASGAVEKVKRMINKKVSG